MLEGVLGFECGGIEVNEDIQISFVLLSNV